MEVILREDVINLGYADDIVSVKNGYARNYLFPQRMAIPATEANKKILAENLKQRSRKIEKIREEAKTLAERLSNIEVNINVKSTDEGTIYGSVSNMMVADALKEQYDIDVDRKKIIIQGDHIKELGQYKATIALHKDAQVELTLNVITK